MPASLDPLRVRVFEIGTLTWRRMLDLNADAICLCPCASPLSSYEQWCDCNAFSNRGGQDLIIPQNLASS